MKKIFPVKKKVNERKPEYKTYRYSAAEFLKYGSAGLAVGLLICWLCYHSIYSLPAAAAVTVIYLKRKKTALMQKRRKLLLYHFKDFLGSLHTALNAGYSLENGIKESLEEIEQMYGKKDVMAQEIRIMILGLKVGKTAEELFYDLGQRSGLEDLRLFAELLAIGKRQGGRLGKILGDTKYIICGKIETEQEIDRQLADKKYEQRIMSLMPACVIIYLRLTFDGFIEQLYGNLQGVIIMSACLAVYALAFYAGERIVKIEV